MPHELDARRFHELDRQLPLTVQLTEEIRAELADRTTLRFHAMDTRVAPRFRADGTAIALWKSSPAALKIQQVDAKIVVRDISRTGFGFLSASQWYPEQEAVLLFPEAEALVSVVRARYRSEACFEIGVRTLQFRSFA